MSDLLEKIRRGDVRTIARLITRVENDETTAHSTTSALYAHTGKAHIVGITGPPGCGKSTLVNEMAKKINSEGASPGVIAIDPTSPFTGGAILGDRVRMSDIASSSNIFVRSMASRGKIGGLARATAVVIKILDVAGYDPILVETVGAGQAEVDIAQVAHTVVVVEAPGSGDEVQTIKAGILEIADVLVVNKSDRPLALNTVRNLEMMLHMGKPAPPGHHGQPQSAVSMGLNGETSDHDQWPVPVLQTIAVNGEGVRELVATVKAHQRYLRSSGEWFQRELYRSRREVEDLLHNLFYSKLQRAVPPKEREQIIMAVAQRDLDPYTAAQKLFELVNHLQ